jgi:hypothetical protein
MGYGPNSCDSGQVLVAGSCDHFSEPLCSKKRGEFLDQLSDYSFSRRSQLHVIR